MHPIRKIVIAGLSSGAFRPVDPELVAPRELMIADGWALKHWNVGLCVRLDEYVRHQTELLLQGVTAPH